MVKVLKEPAMKSQSAQGVPETFPGVLLIQGHGFVYKCFFFCTSSSQRWFPSTTRSNHLYWSIPGLFPVGRHESGLSHLHLLRRAETMTTQSSKSFHGFSAELSNPLCSLQIYLLSIREVDRAALKAQTRVRTMWVCVVTHHSQALWLQAGGHSCFLTSAGSVMVLTSSWSYKASRRCCGPGLSTVLTHHEHLVNVS